MPASRPTVCLGGTGGCSHPVSLEGLCVREWFLPLEPSAFLLSLLWPLSCVLTSRSVTQNVAVSPPRDRFPHLSLGDLDSGVQEGPGNEGVNISVSCGASLGAPAHPEAAGTSSLGPTLVPETCFIRGAVFRPHLLS